MYRHLARRATPRWVCGAGSPCRASSARVPAAPASQRRRREADALAAAASQLDPVFHDARAAICKPNGDVTVQVHLHATRAAPNLSDVERAVASHLESHLDWVSRAAVDFVPEPAARDPRGTDGVPESLHRVRHIVGVGSCKGGVGKSTVTVNLAFALAELGARVGILDGDVYGSNLADMLRDLPGRDPDTGALRPPVKSAASGLLVPLTVGPVAALMSYGFVAPGASRGEQSAVSVRGPVASQIINQLICGTAWGELDYLLVDVPPGTGDIHLTMFQQMPVDGNLIVTTPHALSLADVQKTVQFLRHVHVPVLGAVENMSYFRAGGQRHQIFGDSRAGLAAVRDMVRERHRSGSNGDSSRNNGGGGGGGATADDGADGNDDEAAGYFLLPVDPALADCDRVPVTTHAPESEAAGVFRRAARFLVRRLAADAHHRRGVAPNTLRYDSTRGRLVLSVFRGDPLLVDRLEAVLAPDLAVAATGGGGGDGGGSGGGLDAAGASVQLLIDPVELRARSRDATSTGGGCGGGGSSGSDKAGDAGAAVLPTKVNRKGNYGFEVQWSDGLRGSIYGYDQLLDAAAATPQP